MEITNSNLVDGKGLILRKSVKKGEIVFTLSGKMLDHPTRESIHVGDNKHIYDENGIFINHSFEPTVCIDGYNVRALMDLTDGDEITFNYNDSEINMANTFQVGDVLVCGKKQD
jgi:hypothetical protein